MSLWLYLEQPAAEGYNDGSGKVWHLRKARYGIQQAARQWFIKLTAELCRIHYSRSKAAADPALYVSTQHGDSCVIRSFKHSHVATSMDDVTWIGHGVSKDARRLLKVFPGRYIAGTCLFTAKHCDSNSALVQRMRRQRHLHSWLINRHVHSSSGANNKQGFGCHGSQGAGTIWCSRTAFVAAGHNRFSL
jgi:hypothetical protein